MTRSVTPGEAQSRAEGSSALEPPLAPNRSARLTHATQRHMASRDAAWMAFLRTCDSTVASDLSCAEFGGCQRTAWMIVPSHKQCIFVLPLQQHAIRPISQCSERHRRTRRPSGNVWGSGHSPADCLQQRTCPRRAPQHARKQVSGHPTTDCLAGATSPCRLREMGIGRLSVTTIIEASTTCKPRAKLKRLSDSEDAKPKIHTPLRSQRPQSVAESALESAQVYHGLGRIHSLHGDKLCAGSSMHACRNHDEGTLLSALKIIKA